MYKTLRPLATGLIKKQISKAVGDGIRKGLEALNGQLGKLKTEAAKSKEKYASKLKEALVLIDEVIAD